jgi:hypothetical protein
MEDRGWKIEHAIADSRMLGDSRKGAKGAKVKKLEKSYLCVLSVLVR